jgi:GT2 family glycosyltransferase
MEESQPVVTQVSVLIVSHNTIEPLRRCLAALEASSGRKTMEILVMDNGSRDGCALIDAEFPHITPLRMPRNFGWTKAMNIGMRTAVGELLLFLDPNVEVETDTVSKLAARMREDADAPAVCPLLVDESGAPVAMVRSLPSPSNQEPPASAPSSTGDEQTIDFPGARALMIRKRVIAGMNYIDECYGQFWGDAEICYQVRRAGMKILMLPQARAIWHEPAAEIDSTAYQADHILGASNFIGKHYGFIAGLKIRIWAALKALVTLQLGVFINLLSGQKVDGSHE